MRVAVIGSGPSGVATAIACLERGWQTVLLDGGRTLDPGREAIRRRMAQQAPEQWSAQDLASMSDRHPAGSGLGTKRLFGDAFSTETWPQLEVVRRGTVGGGPSMAVGGLSNVWGATMLQYARPDLAAWGDLVDELEEDYERVATYVPIAAQHDALAELYPLPRSHAPPLMRSPQMTEVLSRWSASEALLRARGVTVGASRLAIRSTPGGAQHGCVYCGRCLHGCVYQHIWSSAHAVAQLATRTGLEHRPGAIVDRVREHGDAVEVHVAPEADASGERFDRVFVAAGPISTFAVLARSGLVRPSVRMMDSRTVFLPMLWTGSQRRISGSVTLSECFVRIAGDHPAAQIQLYPHNDSLLERAAALHPGLVARLGRIVDAVLRSSVVGIGYLHSDVSDGVQLHWDGASVTMSASANPASGPAFDALVRRLPGDLRPLRLVPLPRFAVSEGPGQGFHVGGTYPMGAAGGTDRLGRLAGTTRIHLTDASVFPSIPAGAITYTAMANATRIVRSIGAGAPDHRPSPATVSVP